MISHMRVLFAVMIALVVASAPGCKSTKKPKPNLSKTPLVVPITNTDPCAMRMHDISGALLLYYQKHHHLPPTLEQLRELEFPGLGDFTCPVSKQPYVYLAAGISSPEQGARIVLWDATPVHDHHRWAISIIEPQSDQAPLVAKVIALPASGFRVPSN
jgi:hypothetical protein